MTQWVTSDTHFGHLRILEYQAHTRPYSSVQEMNETMIARWNAKVRPDDEVWHLGDVALGLQSHWESTINRLNGRIHLVRGNHDKGLVKKVPHLFASIQHYKELTYNGTRLVMFHFPISSWNGMHWGSVHVHGHSHGNHAYSWPKSMDHGKSIDVGVDCWGMAPVSFDDVLRAADALEKGRIVDHHKEEE